MCDRFLFTQLQNHCKQSSYLDGEELIDDAQRFLRQIPESRLIHELEKLKEHCIRVIAESGEYIT